MDVCNSKLKILLTPSPKILDAFDSFSEVKASVWALPKTLTTRLVSSCFFRRGYFVGYLIVFLSPGLFCGLFRRVYFYGVILWAISSCFFHRGYFVGYFVVFLSSRLFCGLFRRVSFVKVILWAISSCFFHRGYFVGYFVVFLS